jgi:DNA-binding response OmpR family regulator
MNTTVLVVEDDRAICDLLRLHLDNAGYHVIVAPDAVVAGKTLVKGAENISLLIVDAHLPYMTGIEFVSTVIADTSLPSIPIILITGHEHLVSRAEILGVPCLVKPFGADDLIRLVKRTIALQFESAAGVKDGSTEAMRNYGKEAA